DLLVLLPFPTRRSSDLGTEQAYRHHADHVVLAPGAKVCKCVDEIIRAEGCQHDSGNKHDCRNGADKNAQYAEEGFHFTVPMDLKDRKSTRLNSSHVKIS